MLSDIKTVPYLRITQGLWRVNNGNLIRRHIPIYPIYGSISGVFSLAISRKKKFLNSKFRTKTYSLLQLLWKLLQTCKPLASFCKIYYRCVQKTYNSKLYVNALKIFVLFSMVVYRLDITWPLGDAKFLFKCWKSISRVSTANETKRPVLFHDPDSFPFEHRIKLFLKLETWK